MKLKATRCTFCSVISSQEIDGNFTCPMCKGVNLRERPKKEKSNIVNLHAGSHNEQYQDAALIIDVLNQQKPYMFIWIEDGHTKYHRYCLRAELAVFALEQIKHQIFMQPYLDDEGDLSA